MADTTADPARFDTVTCDPQAPCAGFLVCDACAARGLAVPVATLAWAAPAEGCDPEVPCSGFLTCDRHRQTAG
ncbi:hypothetical protein [Kitasatospora purpeofusca]|uniref:hypothetical protein n=1 Tax=Kitasatospora purpeofusca TaxID=67352 RepID=UPI002A59DCFF|nr:hypothetical protein [Kitasatospora purpeofusca]MDY0816773.1 hypothetical protein [Kitasatospora purpeofusca]